MATSRLCSIPDCGKHSFRRGYCSTHYGRWLNYGDPLTLHRTPNGAPLRWLVDHSGYTGNDCLIWPYSRHPSGYGAIGYENRNTFAHRVMCRFARGEPPTAKHHAAHSCGNKKCCNPRHLRWATATENAADRIAHGTHIRGERQHMAVLGARDVIQIKAMFATKSITSIAEMFSVSRDVIYAIRSGRSWVWVK